MTLDRKSGLVVWPKGIKSNPPLYSLIEQSHHCFGPCISTSCSIVNQLVDDVLAHRPSCHPLID